MVALINANKYDLDRRKADQIASQFVLGVKALAGLEGREKASVRVRMIVTGHVVELMREARSVEELERLLKI